MCCRLLFRWAHRSIESSAASLTKLQRQISSIKALLKWWWFYLYYLRINSRFLFHYEFHDNWAAFLKKQKLGSNNNIGRGIYLPVPLSGPSFIDNLGEAWFTGPVMGCCSGCHISTASRDIGVQCTMWLREYICSSQVCCVIYGFHA